MSETFSAARSSIRKLVTALQEADTDTQYDFAFWVLGLAIMALAVIVAFGWNGVTFCGGFIVWKAGEHGLKKERE